MNGSQTQHKLSGDIINMVRRTLGYVDVRLVDHGDRVAFIADAIASSFPDYFGVDKKTLLILATLHDVGAYKTDEIDQMVSFETDDVLNHSIYGYLFLKHTTSLGDHAEAIRYHHTKYADLQKINCGYAKYAELIFLADRVDILLHTDGVDEDFTSIRDLAGSTFDPVLVEHFIDVEKNSKLVEKLLSGEYKPLIEHQLHALIVDQEEARQYLQMLVYAIDFRSTQTVTHTTNTTVISQELAKRMGLSPKQINDITFGAFLHDIGKISTPPGILEKPGKLDADEMKIMREHVTKSREIIQDYVSAEICEIAARHHERMDGSGYPQNLTADQMDSPEKIVAVADVLSALISRRSYKEPFPRERSLRIITEMRDEGKLCPEVVNELVENYSDILDAIEHNNDPVIHTYESIRNEYSEILAENGETQEDNPFM